MVLRPQEPHILTEDTKNVSQLLHTEMCPECFGHRAKVPTNIYKSRKCLLTVDSWTESLRNVKS